MQIRTFQLGSFMTNCFLVTAGDQAMIVDAPEEIERLIDHCDVEGIRPQLLVNTHGHFDHIAGNRAVKAHWSEITLAIHADDAPKLTSSLKNMSIMVGAKVESPEADRLLAEGDVIELGDERFEVLHTPGHTPGGISLVCRTPASGGPSVALVGDTLFQMGVGRTDFPGGNQRTLFGSIREKLFTLPDETVVYSGHGPETTIGAEKASNPFVSV